MASFMFPAKKPDTLPVFTENDIRQLILSFPPPEPRPGKECLVRSLSGHNLVRSDAVIKRFDSLLENAAGTIFLNSLHSELGVHDIQWLLAQEDARIRYTRDRRRLLPAAAQKAIYQSVRQELAVGGVDLDRIATEKDVTPATLRRILSAQDASLSLVDLEDGSTHDLKLLEKLKTEISEILGSAQEAVMLSDEFPQVPVSWLESTTKSLTSADKNIEGSVESVSGGLRFMPKSLLVQHEDELKQAQDAYIQKAVDDLVTTGYCEVTTSARPQILQKTSDVDLTRSILKAFSGTESNVNVVELNTTNQGIKEHFLITDEELSSRLSSISAQAMDVASEQWTNRGPGEDITFDPTNLLDSTSSSPLDLAILTSGDPENQIKTSFDNRIIHLQQQTMAHLTSTIQTTLLAPLKLYSQGSDTIKDTTLQPRVQEFIYDWSRKELTPEVLRSIKDQNLITAKSTSRELDRFSDAVQAARTLEDMSSATAKLARKLKIDQPLTLQLEERKRLVLEQKVAGMHKMKRASDLLQNVIWILLAREREGLYMSSGKDTSRMIKMVKEGDAEVGARLEEWRDLVKKGEDTEDVRRQMRNMAADAVEGFKASSGTVSSEIVEAVDEQGTEKKTVV